MTDKNEREGAEAPSFIADNVTVFRQAFSDYDRERAQKDAEYHRQYCEQFGKMIASFVGTSAMRGGVSSSAVLNSMIFALVAIGQAIDMSFIRTGREPEVVGRSKDIIEAIMKDWDKYHGQVKKELHEKEQELALDMETKGSA